MSLASVVLGVGLAGCAASGESMRAIQKSMEPTILSGEIIPLDVHAYDATEPRIGDIVSLRAPANVGSQTCAVSTRRGQPCPRASERLTDISLIKRIVAGPGQTVSINREGRARVDGVMEDEPFIIACEASDDCRMPRPMRVPPGAYLVLGDNRPYSSDSRYWGPVPRAAIEGRVTPLDPARR